jgi:hypothetical protein
MEFQVKELEVREQRSKIRVTNLIADYSDSKVSTQASTQAADR